MAKIQNQVESRTVKTEMITNETTYSITSKISTTVSLCPRIVRMFTDFSVLRPWNSAKSVD